MVTAAIRRTLKAARFSQVSFKLSETKSNALGAFNIGLLIEDTKISAP